MLTVSAALIVKNEERLLEGCLSSIAGAVEEIVVVDTGSTDRTIEIARDYGAKLLQRPWRNDFAWARNEGLAAATGDWILYIDADERLTLPEGARLTDNLAGDDVFLGRVRFTFKPGYTPYREYRLLRNEARLRFRGAMHETMLPDFEALKRSVGAREVDSPAQLLHLGFEGDLSAKHARNLPLLRQAVADDPDRAYYWMHLAITLWELGEVDEALAIGCAGMQRAAAADRPGNGAAASTLARFIARREIARGEDPLPTLDEGLRAYPGNLTLQFIKAEVLAGRGAHAGALALLEPLAAIDTSTFCDPTMGFSRRMLEAEVPDLMGVVLLKLGRRSEAAAAYARAAAAAPDEPAYRIKATALASTAREGT